MRGEPLSGLRETTGEGLEGCEMDSERPPRVPLKLRLTIDPHEAEVIRKGLAKLAILPDVTQEDKDTAWSLLATLSKKLIGR